MMTKFLSPMLERPPEAGLVRQAGLIPHVLPFSAATLWRKVKSGEFPQPVKLSARVTAWRWEDVNRWIADPANYQAAGLNDPANFQAGGVNA